MPVYSAAPIGNLVFSGTFLARSRSYMNPDEVRAADAIRLILTHNKPPAGMHAREYANRVMAKALKRIQELGDHAAFADEIEARYGATEPARATG